MHRLERRSQLEQLDRSALALEHQDGKLDQALKQVFLILQSIKKNQDDAQEKMQQAENALKSKHKVNNEPHHTQDFSLRVYSLKLRKDFLERAVFLAVRLGDFAQASLYQREITELNDLMYEEGSHPLQAMQRY